MPVTPAEIAFYAWAAVILGSAVMVVSRKNSIISGLFLAVSLMGVAGLYVTLHAEFLFAVQVLVYTGGVMVLFLFVIMLVNIEELEQVRMGIRGWAVPLVTTVAVFGFLGWLGWQAENRASPGGVALAVPQSNMQAVAGSLLTGYLLPFEIVSVLLLVAMVGAIALAKKEI